LKSKIINRYFKKTLKYFKKQLENSLANPGNEEAIHNLRTSIKRIKAFLKFLKTVNDDFDYCKSYTPWKRLFKKAGAKRMYQVAINKAEEILTGENSNQHHTNMLASEPGFNRLQDQFDKAFFRDARNEAKNSINKISIKKETKKYLKKRVEKLQSLINMNIAERRTRLHVIRKILKEFSYNLPFLKKLKIGDFQNKNLANWLDETMDLLGDWHDNKVLMDELQNDTAVLKYSPQKKKKIREGLEEENKVLLARINHVLDNNQLPITNY
jgi:CHAD domain-containing protein